MAQVIITVPAQPTISVGGTSPAIEITHPQLPVINITKPATDVAVSYQPQEITISTTGVTTIVTREVLEGTGINLTSVGDSKRISVDLGDFTTSNLAEGTNKYYTEARVDANIATKTTDDITEGTNKYYASSLFDADLATKSTTNLTEGTNKYYASSLFDADLATKSTTNLTEGTNLYYTEARVDANFATKTTTDLAEGTNKYYASSLFDADLATKTTDNLDQGTTNKYYASGLFDADLATKTTDNLTEGATNKYYDDTLVATYLTANNYVTSGVNVAFNIIDANAVEIDNTVRYNTITYTTTSTSAETIFATPNKTIKALVEVSYGGEYQAIELLLLNNSSQAYMTQYGELYTGANRLATFTVSYTTSMTLQVVSLSAGTTIKIVTTAILV